MKVAIVHDYIKEYGGAERVVEALLEIWPKAPVYTTIYLPKFLGPHRKRVEKWDVRPSLLQFIPMKGKLLSLFRFIGPLIFKNFDLSEYDVVIVSAAGTYTSPNYIKKGKKTLHICYCHTPPRYLYGYPTAQAWDEVRWRKILKCFGQVPMHFLRMADFNAAQRVDFFIANSEEVAARIEKFYRRKTKVIYPPVDFPRVSIEIHPKGGRRYYLAGGRIARPKRVDLAVKACTKLKLPLKVFGRQFAGYGDELREIAACPPKSAGRRWRPTTEFLGEVSDEEKWKLMAGAKAFIFPAEFEDFGITPVEAMAVGTPVIALRSGGVVESVIDGKTGLFFDEPTVVSLVKTIKKFEKSKIKPEDCMKQAKKFSKERFKLEIKQFINKHA